MGQSRFNGTVMVNLCKTWIVPLSCYSLRSMSNDTSQGKSECRQHERVSSLNVIIVNRGQKSETKKVTYFFTYFSIILLTFQLIQMIMAPLKQNLILCIRIVLWNALQSLAVYIEIMHHRNCSSYCCQISPIQNATTWPGLSNLPDSSSMSLADSYQV